MKEKQIKVPDSDHPLSIERNPARVVVSVAGHVIADTRNALTLREADYPPVQYIPPEDVDFSQLERTDHATYCPYKGDCSYYSVPAGGKKSVNAVWSYDDPYPAVAQIREHVAFYPDRVDEIAEQLQTTRESSRGGVSMPGDKLAANVNIVRSDQPLFTPVRMGELELRNRIVLAPLTRMRAANSGHAPTELHAQYYAQRASAGLIIGECTEISPDAYGWADTPGLWSAEQIRGWHRVTNAVHKKGGLMYAQLWHTGGMSHPDFFDGALPMSASNVNPEQESVTPSGRKPTVAPRPMSRDEIRQTVADFGTAAKNAMEAGFDGVQIQANYLYLIAQFLNSATNLRRDEYGGSIVNRARFLFEIVETVVEFVESGRVGIKIGPMNISGPFLANADTLPNMEYVIKKLNDYDLAHLLMMGATTDFAGGPLEHLAGDGMFQHFRPLYRGHLIANVEMTQERGNRLIKTGLADSIAFGRPFIANPDLPERFLAGTTLNEVSWPTVYASGRDGYIDYPATQRSFPDEASPTRARRHTEPLLS